MNDIKSAYERARHLIDRKKDCALIEIMFGVKDDYGLDNRDTRYVAKALIETYYMIEGQTIEFAPARALMEDYERRRGEKGDVVITHKGKIEISLTVPIALLTETLRDGIIRRII